MMPVSSSRFSRSCTVVRDRPSLRASDATGWRASARSSAINCSSLAEIWVIRRFGVHGNVSTTRPSHFSTMPCVFQQRQAVFVAPQLPV